ncbi:MAG: glycogen/starch synthase [Bacteroidaceae bacterium]|nr:glycogen/starch synthase [Bacteroidaceae bacterium]
MKANKLLFITQEINPYVPDSDYTPMGRNLPLAAIDMGREIRTFMPKWGNINERRNQLHEVIRLSGMNLAVNDVDHPLIIKVASIVGTRMQVYFIDNEDFFGKRLAERDANGVEYKDNVERAVFYARGVLETVKRLRWAPEVIHCQGWASSMVPAYLKTAYREEPSFRDCRVVYTVADNGLTQSTGPNFDKIIAFKNTGAETFQEFGTDLTPHQLELFALKHADGVHFASATPDAELLEFAQAKGMPILIGPAEQEDFLTLFDEVWSQDK